MEPAKLRIEQAPTMRVTYNPTRHRIPPASAPGARGQLAPADGGPVNRRALLGPDIDAAQPISHRAVRRVGGPPTQHSPKKLVRFALRATAATAVPALLFLGAGTAQALPGPGIHFAMDPGVLNVFINDNSAVSSWCTFNADFYHSPQFFLEANKSYQLVIAPAFPFNRTWNVDVNCDNGTNTHGVFFY
jgi:hypothetical protein